MSSTPPPLPTTPRYEARLTLFDKVRIYRIVDDRLEIVQEGHTRRIRLAEITSIRCRYFPTRFQTHRYEMLLTLTHGEKIKIANQFFKGVAQFEDRSADFRKFARSLHQARLAVPPACRFFAGVTPMSFWVSAILLGSIMTILALLVFVFFTTIPLVAIVKLIIVIAMIPIAINWFRKNRPKEYDGAKIPIDILPS